MVQLAGFPIFLKETRLTYETLSNILSQSTALRNLSLRGCRLGPLPGGKNTLKEGGKSVFLPPSSSLAGFPRPGRISGANFMLIASDSSLMVRRSLGDTLGILQDELIRRACLLAVAAHTSRSPTFHIDKPLDSSYTIIAFPGSWSVLDWFARMPFGESKINKELFPSLKSVGSSETALVNESFLRQFETILRTSNLQQEISDAFAENKQVLFAGHSSGAPLAILSTIWVLEQLKQNNRNPLRPFCITFGSPLIGDQVFGHALRREHWSNNFIHFVTRHDIVPRILLAPLPSIERELPGLLHFLNPNSPYFGQDSVGRSKEASIFFSSVMRNTSYVANHDACLLMGCTNPLLESVTCFAELSPYRPFGTYIFSTGNGKLVTVKNPKAVLQMLFYSLQLRPEHQVEEIAYRSLQANSVYGIELQESLQMQSVVYLDNLEAQVPLSTDGFDNDEMRLINAALNDLELGARARISLQAAGELEKQKLGNQSRIDSYISKIQDTLRMLQGYRATCEAHGLGYYDSFKYQKEVDDFNANVNRQELTGVWDGIIEMLRRYELPDDFECRDVWLNLGTKFRRLVEPLDVANYYRHSLNDDTGPYMIKGRPRRYWYIQRWLEYARSMALGSCSESCFWAEMEELSSSGEVFEEVKERVLKLERDVLRWATCGEISRDVFLEESSFVKWWRTLPHQHRTGSCIAALMNGDGRNLPAPS